MEWAQVELFVGISVAERNLVENCFFSKKIFFAGSEM